MPARAAAEALASLPRTALFGVGFFVINAFVHSKKKLQLDKRPAV
jgi:hypothetical protein